MRTSFTEMFEFGGCPLAVASFDGKLIAANVYFRQLLGIRQEGPCVNANGARVSMLQFTNPADWHATYEALARLRSGELAKVCLSRICLDENGENVKLDVEMTAYTNEPDEPPTHIICTVKKPEQGTPAS